MNQEQTDELTQLDFALIPKLRGHGFVGRGFGMHIFQYMILPSFTPLIAWDVFLQRRGSDLMYSLVRTCWRKDLDEEKLRTPSERSRHPYPLPPTIELHQVEIDQQTLGGMRNELREIHLPIGAQEWVCGVDGVSYEVAIGDPGYGFPLAPACRLSWWHEPPPAWSALKAWTQRAEAAFDEAWSTPGRKFPITLEEKVLREVALEQNASRLFRGGNFAQAAALLTQLEARRALSAAETKMRQMAIDRSRSGDSK